MNRPATLLTEAHTDDNGRTATIHVMTDMVDDDRALYFALRRLDSTTDLW